MYLKVYLTFFLWVFKRTNLFLAKVSTGVHSGNQPKFFLSNDELNIVVIAAAFLCQDQRFLCLQDTTQSQGTHELRRRKQLYECVSDYAGICPTC